VIFLPRAFNFSSDKNYFPLPPALEPALRSPTCQKILNYLVTFAGVRTVLLKDSGSRKTRRAYADHVLGDENGIKYLFLVHQKRCGDKIRRHHRASDQVLIAFFEPRRSSCRSSPEDVISTKGSFSLVDLPIKIKLSS